MRCDSPSITDIIVIHNTAVITKHSGKIQFVHQQGFAVQDIFWQPALQMHDIPWLLSPAIPRFGLYPTRTGCWLGLSL